MDRSAQASWTCESRSCESRYFKVGPAKAEAAKADIYKKVSIIGLEIKTGKKVLK